MRHEDERLIVRLSPSPGIAHEPVDPWVAGVHRVGLLPKIAFVGTEHGAQRGTGSEGAANAIDLATPRHGIDDLGGSDDAFHAVSKAPPLADVEHDRYCYARRK